MSFRACLDSRPKIFPFLRVRHKDGGGYACFKNMAVILISATCCSSSSTASNSATGIVVKIFAAASASSLHSQVMQYLDKSSEGTSFIVNHYGEPNNFNGLVWATLPRTKIDVIEHPTLVSACNGGIDANSPFDVLLICDETTIPIRTGYDATIHNLMRQHFPNLDGVISLQAVGTDGSKTVVAAVGQKFYSKFGYIYHPHYKTNLAQKELFETAALLGKFFVFNVPLFKKVSSEGRKLALDFEIRADEETHQFRRQANFNLNTSTGERIVLSILIPTLENRRDMFESIYNKLLNQITAASLTEKAEILYSRDNGEKPTGNKRNELLQASRGEYTCFVDDDDDVSSDYIARLCSAAHQHPDCLRLEGIITVNGHNPRLFIHSLAYKTFFETNAVYYRPPNHLNPIRRDIAIRFKFPDKFISEDSDWTMQVCRSGLVKNELMPGNGPYYFYKYNDKHSVQSKSK